MTTTIESFIAEASDRLKNIPGSGNLEIQLVLATTLEHDRSWILSHPEYRINSTELLLIEKSIKKLEQSIPLPYILGVCHFYGLEFKVTPDVLIPRPETELLVEKALSIFQNNQFSGPILDVGTGSGCIAIAIASHLNNASVVAVDRSMAAIQVAKENIVFHHLEKNIDLINADLVSMISGKFQLICANLPYIPASKIPSLAVSEHEPVMALDGGLDGLEIIHKLLQDANRIAAKQSCLLLEIEAEQGKSARDLAEVYFPAARIQILKDFSGKNRLMIIEST